MVQELRSRVNERLKNEENTRKSSTPLLKVSSPFPNLAINLVWNTLYSN